MKHPLIDLIDAKIREAEAEGAFDDLSGAGKPLPTIDETDYLARTMREHGAVPEFVTLKKEQDALRASLPDIAVSERKAILQKIADLDARIALARAAWGG